MIVLQEVELGFWCKMQNRAARKNKLKMEANADEREIPEDPIFIGARGWEGPLGDSV